MTRIALITDSTSDLPDALARQRRIYIAPQVIVWGRESLKARVDLDPKRFYERLATDPQHPTTSRPTPNDLASLFQQARDEQDAAAVVMLTVSDDVSGTYASAQEALKMVDFPVHVLDTRTVSLALGLTVLAAADARDAGASAAEVLEVARRAAARSRVVFTPSTLEYLHRGGRIGGAKKLLGTALSIKPILHIQNGRVEPLENVRTRKRAVSRLIELVGEQIDPSQPFKVGVLHGNTPQEADALAAAIQTRWNPTYLIQGEICPSIGVHVGPGALGVATLP